MNQGFLADRLIRHYFPFKVMFRHSPLPWDFNTSTIGVLEIVLPQFLIQQWLRMSSCHHMPSILALKWNFFRWKIMESVRIGPLAWEADMLTIRPPGLCWRVFLNDIGKFMKTATSTQGRWDIRRSGQSFDTFWQLYHFRLDFVLIFRCHDKLILMSWKKYKWLHIALST